MTKETYPDLMVSIRSTRTCPAQSLVVAAPKTAGEGFPGCLPVHGSAPELPVGAVLTLDGIAAFKVVGKLPLPAAGRARRSLLLDTLRDFELPAGDLTLTASREGYAMAWIVLSDKGAAGEREDECGPIIEEAVRMEMRLSHAQGFIIPDDPLRLRALATQLALDFGYDVLLTSGGTGLAPRDLTPEATLALIDKRLEGFERAMTAASLTKTPHGAISRAVAGTIGRSIILNLPGSPKAVRENLEAVLPALGHALDKLKGDPGDCAR